MAIVANFLWVLGIIAILSVVLRLSMAGFEWLIDSRRATVGAAQ